MSIYIAGAGAMGSRFGYQLTKANFKVTLLDRWQEHIDVIKTKGLTIKGDINDNIKIDIIKPEHAKQKAKYIILFTKAMQLESMLMDIKHIIDEDTMVLCLLNGLGHEEVIKKYIPIRNIIMGVTVWSAGLKAPGVAHLIGSGTVIMQCLDSSMEQKGKELAKILTDANLCASYDTDALPSIYRKACVNGTMNSLCTLLDCNIGELFDKPDAIDTIHLIVEEFVKIGTLEGIKLDKNAIIEYLFDVSKKIPGHFPSMHQDLCQNKRYTEIDYINGAIVKKAKKYNVEVPYCKLITKLIHIKEQLTINN